MKASNWITLISSLIQALPVAAATFVAWWGIDAWRKELHGRREYELAEEVLALFYEAGELIAYMRSPLGRAGEGSSRKPAEGESSKEKNARDRTYVVYERYNRKPEIFDRLHALRYRCMTLFGRSAGDPFSELHQIRSTIFANADILADLWSEGDPDAKKQNREVARKAQEIVWSSSARPDAIAPKVQAAIEKMEAICQPIIQSSARGTPRIGQTKERAA